jgi:hypothetical protein
VVWVLLWLISAVPELAFSPEKTADVNQFLNIVDEVAGVSTLEGQQNLKGVFLSAFYELVGCRFLVAVHEIPLTFVRLFLCCTRDNL